MKKFMKSLMLVAAVAMGFTACTNDLLDEVNTNTGNTFTLTISAEKPALEGTRTEFSNGSVIWSGVEKIRATYYHTSDVWSRYYASNQNPQIAADGSTATFSIDTQYPAQSAEGEYTFYAGYPQNAIGNSTNAPIDGVLAVTVPTEQTMPKMGTFDVTADIMVGKSLESYTEVIQTIPIYWTRLVSHVCVTLKNLAAEEGEMIKTVTFTAPEGVMLTGAGEVNFAEQSMTTLDNNTVIVNLPANTVANVAELPVWFCSAPATIASGKDFTITVETPRGTYTRTITARSEGIQFVQNKYSTLSINMASAEFTPAAVSANVFQMITSVSELTSGEYVLAAKYNDTYYPMSTTFASKINATSSVTVTNNQIVETDAEGYVLTLTVSGSSVSIYNGSTYLKYNSSTNFTTSTTESTWTVKYVDNQFQFQQDRYILWNYNSGSGRFGAYATSNWGKSDYSGLYLFKKVTNDPTAPTMSLDKSEISIEQAGGSATITATTTNYTGAITATSDNTHFTTSVEGNVVTVTAPANEETTVKTATITITAGTISKEAAVTQAANLGLIGKGNAESPYTVADALKLMSATASENVYTKGIISSIEEVSTSYGNATYNISEDGKTTSDQVKVFRGKYLDNEKFTTEDAIKVGDEVVIYGQLQLYYDTPEILSGNYIFSLNRPDNSNTKLDAPTLLQVNTNELEVSLTWTGSDNATSYYVTCGDKSTTVTTTSAQFTMEAAGTYDITVVAKADGYTDSDALTGTANVTESTGGGDVTTPSEQIVEMDIFGSIGTLASDSSYITWTSGDVTVRNNKTSGSSAILNSDTSYYRVYAKSGFVISVSKGTISKVVITCTSSSYATAMKNSLGNNATASGSIVTWTGSASEISATMTAQSRINKVEVTYTK